MLDPLISVIIPAYNAEKFLSPALDSVLQQSYSNLEILLIDDGSSDETRSIAQNHPAKPHYHLQPHLGVAEARNHGIRKARGDLIAFLDSDDLYLPHKLSSQVGYLQQNPQIDIVVCPLQRVDTALNPYGEPIKSFALGTMLIRRIVFDRVGFFNPEFIQSQDTDWFLRSRDKEIPVAYQTDAGLLYRQHPNSLSKNRVENRKYFLRAIRDSVERKSHMSADPV